MGPCVPEGQKDAATWKVNRRGVRRVFQLIVNELEHVVLVLFHLLADTLFGVVVFVRDGLLLRVLLEPRGEGGEVPLWSDMFVNKLITPFIRMIHQGGAKFWGDTRVGGRRGPVERHDEVHVEGFGRSFGGEDGRDDVLHGSPHLLDGLDLGRVRWGIDEMPSTFIEHTADRRALPFGMLGQLRE